MLRWSLTLYSIRTYMWIDIYVMHIRSNKIRDKLIDYLLDTSWPFAHRMSTCRLRWVLFTTANFPDVMMPSYTDTRASFFFFFVCPWEAPAFVVGGEVLIGMPLSAPKCPSCSHLRCLQGRAVARNHHTLLLAGKSARVVTRNS